VLFASKFIPERSLKLLLLEDQSDRKLKKRFRIVKATRKERTGSEKTIFWSEIMGIVANELSFPEAF
jgi:hypothetical protein